MIVESGNPAHSLADSQRCARRSTRSTLARGDRRGHDRDGPPGRLRAAGADPVREVGGDVLQLRLPAQRVPPAPPAPRARPTARCPSPRSTPGCARRSARSPRPTWRRCAAAARGRAAEFADAFFAATAADPSSARWRRSCSTARSARRCPTAPPRRPSCGARRTAARWSTPTVVRRAGFGGEGLEPASGCSTPSSPSPSGVVFTDDEWDDVWRRMTHRRTVACTSRIARAARRAGARWPTEAPRRRRPRSARSCCRPASAGRSRPTRSSATRPGASATPTARCASAPTDAGRARPRRRRSARDSRPSGGRVVVTVEVDDEMQPGHVSLPNGLGLDYLDERRGAGRHRRRRRTSSPPARTATRWPARRGTSTSRPACWSRVAQGSNGGPCRNCYYGGSGNPTSTGVTRR